MNGHIPGPAEHVLEVVTPRTNAARLSSAEHLFGVVRTGEPKSLTLLHFSKLLQAANHRAVAR